MTRTKKTARQRAEEQLGVAERLVKKLTMKVATLRGELEATEDEWKAATARRDYLAKHPDLQQNSTTSTPGGTTT